MRGIQDFNFVAEGERPIAVAWLLLVLGAIALAVVADGYAAADAEGGQLRRQAERLERKTRLVGTEGRRKAGEQKSVLVARRGSPSFPWDSVLGELELAAGERIAVLNLNTEALARRTRLTAEARGIDDALALLGRLRESPLVREAFLVSHEAKRDAPVAVVAFTLQIDWSVD